MSSVIEQAVQASLVASAPQVPTAPATLRYDREDPFAVRIAFPPPATLEGIEVTWAFARELLDTGVSRPSGEGDVHVRPYDGDRTSLEFRVAEGTAMIHLRTADLRHFLRRSYGLVPAGHEHRHLHVDRDVAALLREA